MSVHNSTTDIYSIYDPTIGDQVIADPGAGGTFNLRGRWGGYSTIASGTRYLPDNIPPFIKFYVYATRSVTIKTQAGVTVATLSAEQVGEFVPKTATTWVCAVHAVGLSLPAVYAHLLSTQGFIDLPLAGWREVASNDIINAAGNGGVLATDTTPTLEFVSGDTDSQMRMMWTNINADPVARQISLPPDLDRTQPIVLTIRGDMVGGTTDTPVIDVDTFFDEADTKVEDATTAFGETAANETATIAAADIPDTATTMSIELTPGTHANDALAVYATYLTYTKKLLTS